MEEKESSYNREIIERGQREQLESLCANFEEIKNTSGQVERGEQPAYQECVEKLGQQRARAEEKLQETQQGNQEGFLELSLASQIALDEMKEALCLASEQYLGKKFGANGQPVTAPPPASAG